MATALHYLDMVPGESCTATAFLKHRIYSSGSASIPATSAIPPFPYETYDLKGQAPAQDSYGAAPQQPQASAGAYGAYPVQQPQAAAQQQYQYQSYQQPAAQPSYASSYNQGYSQQQPAATWSGYTPANQGVGAQSVTAPNPNASTGLQPRRSRSPHCAGPHCVYAPAAGPALPRRSGSSGCAAASCLHSSGSLPRPTAAGRAANDFHSTGEAPFFVPCPIQHLPSPRPTVCTCLAVPLPCHVARRV